MLRASIVFAVVLGTAPLAWGQPPQRPDGWVVISVEDYGALRAKAYPPERPPDPPPVEATLTRSPLRRSRKMRRLSGSLFPEPAWA